MAAGKNIKPFRKVKKFRLPRLVRFTKNEDKKLYIIIDDAGKHIPHSYFKYKTKIWPVYADDINHQECIYLLNEFVGAGEYNFNFLEFFIRTIDARLVIDTRKNKTYKSIKSKLVKNS